jgi:hypothetical protein
VQAAQHALGTCSQRRPGHGERIHFALASPFSRAWQGFGKVGLRGAGLRSEEKRMNDGSSSSSMEPTQLVLCTRIDVLLVYLVLRVYRLGMACTSFRAHYLT